MSLFSIIVPVYNTKTYLERCVKSILNQNYDGFELILVDDGSSDGSADICDEYAKSDKRVRVIHKKNGGVSSARNCGLKMATGDYVWFVDSDDYIQQDALLILHEVVMRDKKDLYVFNTHKENETFEGDLDTFFQRYYFTYVLKYAPWNKLYKRSVLNQYQLQYDEEETIGEDLLFNINYYSHMEKEIQFINKQLYFYDNRPGSAMNAKSKYRIVQQMRLFDKARKVLVGQVKNETVSMLFLLHLISGINQSSNGGLTSKEFAHILDFSKYRADMDIGMEVKKDFYLNERASRIGSFRIEIVLFFMRCGWYRVAAKIMGLQ